MHQTSEGLSLAPTDLGNFLGCRHLSVLDLGAARGSAKPPIRYSPMLEDLRQKGMEHEEAYLGWLRDQGLAVVDARGRGVQATTAAMRAGVDVIYQAALSDDRWSGHADFLRKVPMPSRFGDWSYEVYDTKLARDTRAATILQLCVYSHLLEKIQDTRPSLMHVVTPGRDFKSLEYRVDDYGAYFRLLAGQMDPFLSDPATTYPERVSHCDYCAWWLDCEKRRRGDDHLCYVAGISRGQIESLREQGIDRLEDLATLDPVPPPSRGSQAALARVRDQARAQKRGRDTGKPFHELREPFDAEHGFALLPEPAEGDVFLDFEGDRFAEGGVHEYLLGYVMADSDGQPQYTPLWAAKPEQERGNFETFIDLVICLRNRDPGTHVYHFAPYEPSALKRLMGRYATREVELDELLRGNALVDLHQVVKRSLIASVERYSIKDLEPFFGYKRDQDLREASQSMRLVESAVADGSLDTGNPHSRIVEDYNREDCESTLRLRDWLEGLRADVVSTGHAIPRPLPESGEASKEVSDLDKELQALRDGLLAGVPDDPDDRTEEERARFALAHMMEFHRREDKASWWEYFRLCGLDEDDLLDERRAVAGLDYDRIVEATRAPVQRYRFATQDLDVRRGDSVHNLNGKQLGEVVSVDYGGHAIDIKKRMDSADEHPAGVVLHRRVSAATLRDALKDFGKAILAKGFEPRNPYRAAVRLLLRRPPSVGTLPRDGEDTIDTVSRIALSLDGEVLAIQGPPGTGKTYTGGAMICALVEKGLKVGVTAVSHKVIVNLLESSAERARERGLAMRIVHRDSGEYEGDLGIERIYPYARIQNEMADGRIDLLGATAWCWTRSEFQQSVDVLVVDEAGQMSLANVLAASQAGRSLVLLGDPQQLEQPLQSSHPEGSEVSALSHLLDGAETMPDDRGLFLAETYRLHPDIVGFTSEVYYQGRVQALPGLERQRIVLRRDKASPFVGAGLRYVPVTHTGNQARSMEEADVIARLVDELVDNCDWRDQDGMISPLKDEDLLVVAPYNAQVSALSEAIPRLAERIGTVDRFQGQEAPVVIYSMTSSSADDAPRGMEFLYNPFRFNVATSRARALCILVGSPELFQPECRTPAQMRMANGFCRYRELAEVVDYGDPRRRLAMQTKTSLTHPLKIDAMPCGGGLLGMTLCPGKQVTSNRYSRWERDLSLDMSVIVDWGASTLVSLMEEHEFHCFGVADLGDVVEEAELEWHCLPIIDVSIPDERFERLWTYSGHVLRGKLALGERIVLHCRGGWGRTGTIGARLAIECGVAPEEAMRRVRAARAGTVENRNQEGYVLRQRAVASDDRYYADRVLGCLLGGAVGDALGFEVEFSSLGAIRERFGPEGIRQPALDSAGKAIVSDDTQMTLFTAEGLIEGIARNGSTKTVDVLGAVRAATLDWYAMQMGQQVDGRLAEYAVLGEDRARGTTCASGCALGAKGTPENPINNSKTCGGVMRVAPVGLWLGLSDEEAFELAARCAAQTHGHPSGYLSAGALASIVRNLLGGLGPDRCAERSIEIARKWPGARETVDAMEHARALAGQRLADHAEAVAQLGKGWVGEEALAIGLYSALVASDFAGAVRIASNHSGDSDSTASIAGQIHGAWKGLAGIPHTWIRRLDALDPLLDVAGRIIAARSPS